MLGVYAERAYQLEQGPRDPRFDANYAATGTDGKPLTFAEAKEVRLLQREQARHSHGHVHGEHRHRRADASSTAPPTG